MHHTIPNQKAVADILAKKKEGPSNMNTGPLDPHFDLRGPLNQSSVVVLATKKKQPI